MSGERLAVSYNEVAFRARFACLSYTLCVFFVAAPLLIRTTKLPFVQLRSLSYTLCVLFVAASLLIRAVPLLFVQ